MRIPKLPPPSADTDYSKKSVGRPRTNYTKALYEPASNPVGRPKKNKVPDDTPKRPVGRPRKNPIKEPKPPKVKAPKKVSVKAPPKVSVKAPPKVSIPKPKPAPSVPRITKQAFFDYLDDETDNVGTNITFANVKNASKDFLEAIGADMIELFNEIAPEMKGVVPPSMVAKNSPPKEQKKRVVEFMKVYNKLPDIRKEAIKSFMNLNKLSTGEIIALMKKKNPHINVGGLDKRDLIKRYLEMK